MERFVNKNETIEKAEIAKENLLERFVEQKIDIYPFGS
jgi:hypothetical protein